MKTQTFEIRVALLGYVSAGKSTVLNALLQGKYSQTGMHRTTAGVNCFPLYNKEAKSAKSSSPATDEREWSPVPDTVHTSEQALLQISEDNEKLRSIGTVQESTFSIELAEPICEMRSDTTLVLVDIPGLNEAGSKDMYLDYVNTKWDTFDCAVVVMDVFQGVNTKEQVKLLEVVTKNVNELKEIPVIVLCNKVDDPDNKEVMKFVQEVSEKVDAFFQDAGDSSHGVTFIPMSAENAFVYRMAARQSLQDFKSLDESLIDRIGCDEVGKTRWRNLSKEERYRVAYEAVSNKANYEGNLKATNFHSFLEAMDHYLGEPVQLAIIHKQLDVCMKSHDFDRIIAHELGKAHDMCKRLDMPPLKYAQHFWGIYDNCSAVRFQAYSSDMDLNGLHEAMLQLIEYAKFLESAADRGSELEKALDAMTSLISKQVRWIVQHSDCQVWLNRVRNLLLYDWNGASWYIIDPSNQYQYHHQHQFKNGKSYPPGDNEHHWKRKSTDDGWENVYTGAVIDGENKPHRGKLTWASLSPLDFCTMSQSILLNSCSASFCFYVGPEKRLLEKIVSDFGSLLHRLESKYDTHFGACTRPANAKAILCEWTEGKFNDQDEFEPECPAKYECVAQIAMPKRLSDLKHWGHLAWMFCTFMDSLAMQPSV
jgi:GTPase SAR1 family protein